LGIFLFQSRRAFLVAVSATLFSGGIDWRKAVVLFIAAIVFAGYIYYADYVSISTRFAEYGSEGRTRQYSEAWFWIQRSPLIGYGYGEQVQDKYVHNFFLGSWFMMGLAGLALSLLFAAAVAPLALGTGSHRWLLFIPIFDVFTGSNVEGILTFSSWTALAILSVIKYDYGLVSFDSASATSSPARIQPA
jgi:O-antigen ligase